MTTYNSARFLERCLNALWNQRYQAIELIVVDNASSDGTLSILKAVEQRCTLVRNEHNLGFSAGQNRALREARGEWLLSLNPDVILESDFVAELVGAAQSDQRIGTLCGKLLRLNPNETDGRTRVIDSTGIVFTRNLRHFDRGADELDRGHYDRAEFVFGATGAAAMYRQEMIQEVAIAGEFFDESFFAYREDADVAWRAQLMDWRCLYVPTAVGWHVRRVTPERVRQLPVDLQVHCVKNRFLMRLKNISARLYLRLLLPITARDLLIAGYSIFGNPRLLSAFRFIWRERSSTWRKRQWIQARRKVSDAELLRWFGRQSGEPAGARSSYAGHKAPERASSVRRVN
jgi:GT2 family glycosyltransferase